MWVEEGVVSRPARRKFSHPTQHVFEPKPLPSKFKIKRDLSQIVQKPRTQEKKKLFALKKNR
jgi:hypothetical protein